MNGLADKQCVPCKGGDPALRGDELRALYDELGSEWEVVDEHHLVRRYAFPDFLSALAFTNEVGDIAEEQGHHPDILLGWGKVEITIWTHVIDGLTESDFVLAARIERRSRQGG